VEQWYRDIGRKENAEYKAQWLLDNYDIVTGEITVERKAELKNHFFDHCY
jgi:hypothetical protein